MQYPCEGKIPQLLSRTLKLCDVLRAPTLNVQALQCILFVHYSRSISSRSDDCPGSFLGIAVSLGFTGNPVVAELNNAINCK